MAEVHLSAELRTEFGKGGARRTRRAGKIPAVIYGHGADPRHVSLPDREFANAIRHGGHNVLITLDIEGDEQLVIPKAIQRHAIKNVYEHVDLVAVRRGEKITIEVPLSVVGDVIVEGMLTQERMSVSIEAEATHLPTQIEVSIEGLAIGTQVTAGDLTLPTGSVLAGDPHQTLLIIQEAPTAEQIEAEMAEAAEELGIVEDQPDAVEGEEAPEGSSDDDAERSE